MIEHAYLYRSVQIGDIIKMSNPIHAHILKINSSGRNSDSHSRALVDKLVERLSAKNPNIKITDRDTAKGVEFVNETWISANFSPPEARSKEQVESLQGSDTLLDELFAADTLVFGVPIYNFGIPASLKAWFDQVARAGRTFQYTENGPQGLVEGKKAYVIIASGGIESGSDNDYATAYMHQILGFLGITDVEIIAADQLMMGEETKLAHVHELIEAA